MTESAIAHTSRHQGKVAAIATVLGLLTACSSGKRATFDETPKAHRRIAEACWSMLHSSLTNEMEISPTDPRVPPVIRALQPQEIVIQGTDVVIMRAGEPGEYHLSYRGSEARPWVLYGAGSPYDGHQELVRLNQK